MNREPVDFYSDYLLSSFDATTETGLSEQIEGSLSHDQIARPRELSRIRATILANLERILKAWHER